MDDVTIARALHVLAVVLWIGGVGLVTTVLLPLLRRLPDLTPPPIFRLGALGNKRIAPLAAGLGMESGSASPD